VQRRSRGNVHKTGAIERHGACIAHKRLMLSESSSVRPQGSEVKVLVVDDDADFSEVLSLSLLIDGFTVDVAHTVGDAHGRLREGSPAYDLVIADVRFPGESGLELLLGDSMDGPGVPLILMTAYGSPELQEFVEEMGSCLLEKPFPLELLGRRVSAILQEKRMVRARGPRNRPPAVDPGRRPGGAR
jgi:DNA-binding response OmpR family regulator